MKFGVRLPRTGPFTSAESVVRVALKAEELGFDSLTASDHFTFEYESRHHFSVGSAESVDRLARDRATVAYDALTVLAYVAAMTKRVRLIPTAIALPCRHPVILAKEFATLQELSGGRLVLGVCIGFWKRDFQSMNVPYEERGAVTDEYLDALISIFSDKPETVFNGRFVSFSGEYYPKPSKAPIWIMGGFNEKSLQRVAKYGDGWIPLGTPEQLAAGLPRVKAMQREAHGAVKPMECGPESFICIGRTTNDARRMAAKTIEEIGGRLGREAFARANFVGSASDISKQVEAYVNAGANYADLKFIGHTLDQVLQSMESFAGTIMRSFS